MVTSGRRTTEICRRSSTRTRCSRFQANALAGGTDVDYFGAGGRDGAILAALDTAVAELGAPIPATPIETGEFSAHGAGSVPPVAPLLNRGSYGHLIEAAE